MLLESFLNALIFRASSVHPPFILRVKPAMGSLMGTFVKIRRAAFQAHPGSANRPISK
jgi:hypothetical protein